MLIKRNKTIEMMILLSLLLFSNIAFGAGTNMTKAYPPILVSQQVVATPSGPTCSWWDIVCWLKSNTQLSIVSTSTTAPSICSTDNLQTTCSVSNYIGLQDQCDLSHARIEGVSIQGLSSYFSQHGVSYSKCKFQCSASGWGGTSLNIPLTEGSIGNAPNGDRGCFYDTGCISANGFTGGNAFSVSCSVIFYNEVCTPNWACSDWGVCSSSIQTRDCNDGCGNTRTESQSCTTSPTGLPIAPTPTPSFWTDPAGWFLDFWNNIVKAFLGI